ncbi:hypothetical protein LUZ63_019454 [Rhynchospora breviuscula]|uniref:Uncharacterized protein n=1 Tax=Rhynchospora breviuscula TaxID=2022672 RepID=A0A9Q0HJC2_9POAL|nr:hypothetical protein LUZ63_019454 [Rhynchospora breviuscula]
MAPSEEENIVSTVGSVLESCARDLTAEAISLDPIVGRDVEIEELITYLEMRTRRNVILLGDPGVGMTAVVEGLAQKIVNGTVSAGLRDCRIIALNMASFIGGTEYRGLFEKKISLLVQELEKANGEIILFVDEVHMLVGAGRGGRSDIDAANLLKPILSSGDIRFVGATTFEEYAQYVKPDAAFARRFNLINVNEPSRDNCISFLHKLVPLYEERECVVVDPKAIPAAVDLTIRNMPATRLPDKAIQVLILACSIANGLVPRTSATKNDPKETKPEETGNRPTPTLGGDQQGKAGETHQKLQQEQEDEQADGSQKKAEEKILYTGKSYVSKKFPNLRWRKSDKNGKGHQPYIDEDKKKSGSSKMFSKLRLRKKPDGNGHGHQSSTNEDKKISSPATELSNVQLEREEPNEAVTGPLPVVTVAHIEMAVSRKTGIPIYLGVKEKNELEGLEGRIKERVVGQNHVIKPIVDSIIRARAGYSNHTKPIGSFLLIGESGVGKTELAKTIALELYHDETRLITINMGEYYEENSVSRLLGSPGNVGVLTEEVFQRPASILMFEHVEEAHRVVLNALVGMITSATLRDGRGRKIDFSNTLVLMSSHCSYRKKGNAELTSQEIRNKISQEFLNRFENKLFPKLDTLVFDELTDEHMNFILRKKILEISERMEVKGLNLEATPRAIEYARSHYYNKGVRAIEGWLEKVVGTKLAEITISAESSSISKIVIDSHDNELLYHSIK